MRVLYTFGYGNGSPRDRMSERRPNLTKPRHTAGHMAGKNSNGNGQDDDDLPENVTRIPTLAERDRMRREAEKAARAAQKAAARSGHHEPIFNLPPFTKKLLGIIIGVHLVMFGLEQFAPKIYFLAMVHLGLVPVRYTMFEFGWPNLGAVLVSPVSHMFLHGGWMHLFMNTTMMLAFGAGLEKYGMKAKPLFWFFIITGVIGAVGHFILNPFSTSPLVGASGGISGMFAGIVMTMQRYRVIKPGFKALLPFIAVWVGISILFGVIGMPGDENVNIAWADHVVGFIAGMVLFNRFVPPTFGLYHPETGAPLRHPDEHDARPERDKTDDDDRGPTIH